MLTWIVIAIAICLIFGVIKIEQVKKYTDAIVILAKNLFSKAKTEINKQISANQKTKEEKETKED